MPHSTRKNRTPTRRTYQTVGADGWTIVSHGRPRAGESPFLDCPGSEVAAVEDGLTLTALQRRFNAYEARWKGSTTWASLKGALRKSIVEDGLRVENCVLIALGSLSGETRREGWQSIDRTRHSLSQLAALKSILDVFGGSCLLSVLATLRPASLRQSILTLR